MRLELDSVLTVERSSGALWVEWRRSVGQLLIILLALLMCWVFFSQGIISGPSVAFNRLAFGLVAVAPSVLILVCLTMRTEFLLEARSECLVMVVHRLFNRRQTLRYPLASIETVVLVTSLSTTNDGASYFMYEVCLVLKDGIRVLIDGSNILGSKPELVEVLEREIVQLRRAA